MASAKLPGLLLGALATAAAGCKSPTRAASDPQPAAAESDGLPVVPVVADPPLEGRIAELDALRLPHQTLLFIEDGRLWRNFDALEPIARIAMDDLEGYHVYQGSDGDLWRRKDFGWRPRLRVERKLSGRLLPEWTGAGELAALPFYEIREGERLAAWQSAPLPRARAHSIWREAVAHPVAGFTPVLYAQELREPPLAPSPNKAVAADVLAAGERALSGEPDFAKTIADMKRELAALPDAALAPASPAPFLFEITEGKPVLLLLPGQPCDVLPMLRFSAPNQDLESEELAAVMCAWRDSYGAEIVHVGGDYLEAVPGRTLSPAELRTLAWQQFAFDLDIVLQGSGTAAALARELSKGRWYFWWD